LRVFEQNARLKARALLLADPPQFEFGSSGHLYSLTAACVTAPCTSGHSLVRLQLQFQ
jgi:hypothetical protein